MSIAAYPAGSRDAVVVVDSGVVSVVVVDARTAVDGGTVDVLPGRPTVVVEGGGSSGAPLPTMLVGDAGGPATDVVPAPGFVAVGSDETGPVGGSVEVVSSVPPPGWMAAGALGRPMTVVAAGSDDETAPRRLVELEPGVDALDEVGAATVDRSVTRPGSALVEVSIESEPEHDAAASAAMQTHAVSRPLETTDASLAKRRARSPVPDAAGRG